MPLKVTKGGRTIVNNFLGLSKRSKRSKRSKKSSRHARRLTPSLTKKQIQSTMGRIQPPLDVSNNNLNKLLDVIKAGPITIMLVHANWCGHCHHLMPHWDKASQLKNRSVQTVKVEESMLPKVNAALSKMNNQENSIKVEGYPSGFLVSNKGDIVEKIALSPETLPSLMTKTGPIADEMIRREEGESEGEGEGEGEDEGEGEGEVSKKFQSVKPSIARNDLEGAVRTPQSVTGGSLYSLMAKTTYTLAPTIALLATAKTIMKKPRGTHKRSTHKRSTHKRSTHKRSTHKR